MKKFKFESRIDMLEFWKNSSSSEFNNCYFEISEWCDIQFGQAHWEIDFDINKPTLNILFENSTDATAFKLKFNLQNSKV